MLTVLPCGGLGELDPKGATMRIVCSVHISWEHDGRGGFAVEIDAPTTVNGEPRRSFRHRELPSCGAITELDHAGLRQVVGNVRKRESAEAAA